MGTLAVPAHAAMASPLQKLYGEQRGCGSDGEEDTEIQAGVNGLSSYLDVWVKEI